MFSRLICKRIPWPMFTLRVETILVRYRLCMEVGEIQKTVQYVCAVVIQQHYFVMVMG